MELITTALLAYLIAKALDSKEQGSSAAQPAAGKKPTELAAKWAKAPVRNNATLNKATAFTADKAAVAARHTLVIGKTLAEGWKASWRQAWDVLWEPNAPDPPDDDPDDGPDEPDEPDPDPEPTPDPPKPAPKLVKAPPTELTPGPEPDKDGLQPGAYPYDPRRERPVRIVKSVPDPAPPAPAAPSGRTSTMPEVTNYTALLTFLVDKATVAGADLEIAKGDADSAKLRAADNDLVAAQIAALNLDAETVSEMGALTEADMAYAQALEAAATAAERRMATAQRTHTNVRQRYQMLVEAAAAAPSVPDKQFIQAQ